ncbi:hypothetical protein [Paenibacillus sp. J2TS4]|uniref:hypothetical protein n=1 Tax=Paenibacillus sp. J2TS4 TaxID=2807194 RepID=UPI001B058888|nr:hypothetical protein [Paenibacillus sp. J2TS4]GIP33853.1 hypothetical protein J2TS4_30630 [Paenibacillus sp. J2TS4]
MWRPEFIYDVRLGIHVPDLPQEWASYSEEDRSEILFQWEQIRGRIPDRIKEIEMRIIEKQERLNIEDNFTVSCRLNSEIAELASRINDLHLWYRVNQEISAREHH